MFSASLLAHLSRNSYSVGLDDSRWLVRLEAMRELRNLINRNRSQKYSCTMNEFPLFEFPPIVRKGQVRAWRVAGGRARARVGRGPREVGVGCSRAPRARGWPRWSVSECARARAALRARAAVAARSHGVVMHWRLSRVRCDGWRAGAGGRLARAWRTFGESSLGTRLKRVT